MTKIAPSILSADFTRLGEQVQALEAAGVDRFQVDVMDGRFVPNITFGALAIESLRPLTRLTIEAHLMVEPPEDFIERFAKAGGGYYHRPPGGDAAPAPRHPANSPLRKESRRGHLPIYSGGHAL